MNQRDGFTGGFIAGAIFGGVVGGVLGTLLTQRSYLKEDEILEPGTARKLSTEESIEGARRRLEDKIAQLNLAIDDVRQRMEHQTQENE